MNETDFKIDVERKYKVITRTDNITRYLFDLDNHDYITFIENISITDESYTLMFILKTSFLLER